jgi:hypothetical protein
MSFNLSLGWDRQLMLVAPRKMLPAGQQER